MALAYSDAFWLEEINPLELADFANRAGMPLSLVAREPERMAQAMKSAAPELARSEVYQGDERDLVDHVAGFIGEQAERLARIAPALPKVDRALFQA
jgi:serine/threonine-protein kinase HipA